jgi:hypothetical protein
MLSLKSRLGKAWTKSTGKELGNITIMNSVNLQTEHLSSPMDG